MPRSNSIYVIRSRKQLSALASAARQEIIDVLAQMGEVPVSELASVLGRPADALYYHLRSLRQAGLIKEHRSNKQAGREAALFSAIGKDLRIDYEAARSQHPKMLNAIISSMLRLGIRDFRNTLRDHSVVVSGKERELWALRKTGWLSKDDLRAIVKHMEELGQSVARPSRRGKLYGITIVLTPLERQRGRRRRTAG